LIINDDLLHLQQFFFYKFLFHLGCISIAY